MAIFWIAWRSKSNIYWKRKLWRKRWQVENGFGNEWPPNVMQRPNFIIMGQPRSGTTALFGFLAQHPQVFMPELKEPHFFARDFHEERREFFGDKAAVSNYIEEEPLYLELFPEVQGKKIYGEASTHYLYSKEAARSIAEFNPQARVVVLLREPVDFLFSIHQRWVLRTYEDEPDFEAAIEKEASRKLGKDVPSRIYCPSLLFYRERVAYSRQLERLFQHIPRPQVKVIIYDDYRADNALWYERICEFLEIDTNFKPDFELTNKAMAPRSKLLNKILHNETVIALIRFLVPKFIRRLGDRLLWKDSQKPKLDPQFKKSLQAEFYDEVKQTGEILGVDLLQKWEYKRDKT